MLLVLLALAAAATLAIRETRAVTSTPTVNRVFYMTKSNLLNPSFPPPGSPATSNLTANKVEFIATVLLSEMTISGRINFSLWINASFPTLPPTPPLLNINGTFSDKLPGQAPSNITMADSQRLSAGEQRYNFTGNVQPKTLFFGSSIFISIAATTDRPANVTLLWGSSAYPSLVILPISGYVTLSPDQPVEILDSDRRSKTNFDLNSTDKLVFFRVSVFASFGLEDIQRIRVNLTVVGPNLLSVASATNLTMLQFPPGTTSSLSFTYITSWTYPSNSTQGAYQVYIDIVDRQNRIAFSFRGPATFVLTRGLFPESLIPYFAASGVGGVGVVGGIVYYRHRKSKSYLVPFDYFKTLTGGEIDGGTVVAIEGNTGSGKTILSEQLMFEDLKNGRPCVFVATGDFPSNIRAGMKNLGLDVTGYEQRGLLTFVDGYSSEAGQASKEKFSIPSLGDLTTLGIKITSSLPDGSFKGGSLYFDSLTPLVSKVKPESIVSLVHSVGARVRGMSGKAFFTLGPSLDPKVQRQLEELSDCVVQMEAFEERGVRKSRLKIAKHRARKFQQGWVLYTIEDGKGMIFYSKKPRK